MFYQTIFETWMARYCSQLPLFMWARPSFLTGWMGEGGFAPLCFWRRKFLCYPTEKFQICLPCKGSTLEATYMGMLFFFSPRWIWALRRYLHHRPSSSRRSAATATAGSRHPPQPRPITTTISSLRTSSGRTHQKLEFPAVFHYEKELPVPRLVSGFLRKGLDAYPVCRNLCFWTYSWGSVADPGSGAVLTPGSGIRDGWKNRIRVRDPDLVWSTRIIFPRA